MVWSLQAEQRSRRECGWGKDGPKERGKEREGQEKRKNAEQGEERRLRRKETDRSRTKRSENHALGSLYASMGNGKWVISWKQDCLYIIFLLFSKGIEGDQRPRYTWSIQRARTAKKGRGKPGQKLGKPSQLSTHVFKPGTPRAGPDEGPWRTHQPQVHFTVLSHKRLSIKTEETVQDHVRKIFLSQAPSF